MRGAILKKLNIVILLFVGSIIATALVYNINSPVVYEINDFEAKSTDIELKPGSTIQFKFQDTYEDTMRICELRVPENYSEDRLMPIFVWFSPGHGSYSVESVPSFVDFSEYFVLALPYLNNQLPRLAIRDGYIDDLWEYDKPMLEYVKTIIPNLSSSRRIAAGFSSGAHFVATGLDKDWEGFTDFFTGYVIHEGGYAPKMIFNGIEPSDKVLVTYGVNFDSSAKTVAQLIAQDRANVTVYGVPNTKHEITDETLKYVRAWIFGRFSVDES